MDVYHIILLAISVLLLATCLTQAVTSRRLEKAADFFDPEVDFETREAVRNCVMEWNPPEETA